MPQTRDSVDRSQYTGSADLVLAGGGVKGIGLIGALEVLEDRGYRDFRRVAGTSVGAIVGALVAAGFSASAIADELMAFDFLKLRDTAFPDQIPVFGRPAGLLVENGIYEGEAVRTWLAELLRSKGVETFGDLKATAARGGASAPPGEYPLVVFATDITLGRLVRLPDDFQTVYGLDPDAQSVANSVRASMSIPYFFEPVQINRSRLVDGAVLSNYAIDAFDKDDPATARWPTFGMTLMAFDKGPLTLGRDLARSIFPALRFVPSQLTSFHEDLIGTVIAGQDRHTIDRRGVKQRTIEIDANEVGIVEFDLSEDDKRALIKKGRAAATTFMDAWDGHDGRAHAGKFPVPAMPPAAVGVGV
ncbi:MAG: patatin-like phospholipase family protein [Solirubrobacterales bacterium]